MVGGCRGIFYKKVGEESSSGLKWWKNYEVQVGSLLKEFCRSHLYQFNKYRGFRPRWKDKSRAQWDILKGGCTD
jgi:hypothetical protein